MYIIYICVYIYIYPKASPLPPAPSGNQLAVDLQTRWIWKICRIEIIGKFSNCIHLFKQISFMLFNRFIDFRCLGGPFFKHSGSCDTTFSLIWWPLGARMHSDGTRIDFQWFLMDFGSPIGDHSGSLFHIFFDLSSPKSHLDCSHVFCWFLNGKSDEFWCPNPSKVH